MGKFININLKCPGFSERKKEEKKEPTPAEIAKQKQMEKEKDAFEVEKNLENLQKSINGFDAKISNLEKKISEGETQVKQLIQAGQKDKAKRTLKNVKRYKDEIVGLQGKLNFLEKQKIQIESQKDDAGFYDALKDGNKIIAKNQEKQEQMLEEVERAKELENEGKMHNEMLANYFEDSADEDLDDELAGYEQDLALEMDANFNNANSNIISQPQQQTTQPQKKNDVDDMFANLMAS